VTAALRAEVRKLLTTQVCLWLALLGLGLSVAIACLVSGFSKVTDGGAPLDGALNAAIGFSSLIAAVLGVIGLTGEYRHLTATPTFLAVPRRGRVVGAKLITYVVAGLLLGVLCVGASLAVAAPWLDSKGFPIDLGSDSTRRIILGGILSVAIFGVIGVGVGALLRNQVAAVVGIVIYLFVAEPILSAIPGVQKAYPYLPGGASSAMTTSSDPNQQNPNVHLLEPWQGGLLLLAYGLAFAILGSLLTVRRDVS
jgi:ABC-2 type transport system permease protein